MFAVWCWLQQVNQLRREALDKEAQLKEKEQFHENEVANNQEVEKKIAAADRSYSKLKMEYQDAERLRDTFNSEVSWVYLSTCQQNSLEFRAPSQKSPLQSSFPSP